MSDSIYDFVCRDIKGEEKSLSDYKGKVLLIVNTASKCGYTSQYKGLESLYQSYQDKGFVVLGFPCNQFMGQEPGTEEEIENFCSTRFQVTFPMFSKIDVKGDSSDPLYQFLTKEAKGVLGSEAIKWNFTKFLVSSDGKNIERFATATKPEEMEAEIKALLG